MWEKSSVNGNDSHECHFISQQQPIVSSSIILQERKKKDCLKKQIFIANMEVCPSWNSNVISMDKLTDLQTRTLERIFEVCQRPSGYVIGVIARQMELSEVSVKTYFDNAAQVKNSSWRQQQQQQHQQPSFKIRLDFEASGS